MRICHRDFLERIYPTQTTHHYLTFVLDRTRVFEFLTLALNLQIVTSVKEAIASLLITTLISIRFCYSMRTLDYQGRTTFGPLLHFISCLQMSSETSSAWLIL